MKKDYKLNEWLNELGFDSKDDLLTFLYIDDFLLTDFMAISDLFLKDRISLTSKVNIYNELKEGEKIEQSL